MSQHLTPEQFRTLVSLGKTAGLYKLRKAEEVYRHYGLGRGNPRLQNNDARKKLAQKSYLGDVIPDPMATMQTSGLEPFTMKKIGDEFFIVNGMGVLDTNHSYSSPAEADAEIRRLKSYRMDASDVMRGYQPGRDVMELSSPEKAPEPEIDPMEVSDLGLVHRPYSVVPKHDLYYITDGSGQVVTTRGYGSYSQAAGAAENLRRQKVDRFSRFAQVMAPEAPAGPVSGFGAAPAPAPTGAATVPAATPVPGANGEDPDTEQLTGALFGSMDEADESTQAVSKAVMDLKNTTDELARTFYGIILTDPEALKVVREILKILSGRVADIPIEPAIDSIDHYLDKYEKKGRDIEKGQKGSNAPPGAKPPAGNTPPAPVAPEAQPAPAATANPNTQKSVPPWAQVQ